VGWDDATNLPILININKYQNMFFLHLLPSVTSGVGPLARKGNPGCHGTAESLSYRYILPPYKGRRPRRPRSKALRQVAPLFRAEFPNRFFSLAGIDPTTSGFTAVRLTPRPPESHLGTCRGPATAAPGTRTRNLQDHIGALYQVHQGGSETTCKALSS
jgi:hypothetical protein